MQRDRRVTAHAVDLDETLLAVGQIVPSLATHANHVCLMHPSQFHDGLTSIAPEIVSVITNKDLAFLAAFRTF